MEKLWLLKGEDGKFIRTPKETLKMLMKADSRIFSTATGTRYNYRPMSGDRIWEVAAEVVIAEMVWRAIRFLEKAWG